MLVTEILSLIRGNPPKEAPAKKLRVSLAPPVDKAKMNVLKAALKSNPDLMKLLGLE